MGPWIADGTGVDKPTPGPNGTAPFRPRTRPARIAVSPRGTQDVRSGPVSTWRSGPPPSVDAPGGAPVGAEWTFSPDHAFVSRDPLPEDLARAGPEAPQSRPPTPLAARVGAVVIVAALFMGALAVTHSGPFQSSSGASAPSPASGSPTDVRGTWDALFAFQGSLFVQTLHITTESLRDGVFSGTVTAPVGIETLTGSMTGAAMSFTIRLGTDTETGTGTVSTSKGRLQLKGNFSNGNGAQGTITAKRSYG
jgi:hypothetical protein